MSETTNTNQMTELTNTNQMNELTLVKSIDQFQCLYVLDKYGEIDLKDEKRKKFDLTLYQQNYLEKSFRYKQDQFAKIKDKNANGDIKKRVNTLINNHYAN